MSFSSKNILSSGTFAPNKNIDDNNYVNNNNNNNNDDDDTYSSPCLQLTAFKIIRDIIFRESLGV